MVNDEGHLMIILVIFLLLYESMANEGCYIITIDISLLLHEGMVNDEGHLMIILVIFLLLYESMANEGCYIITVDISLCSMKAWLMMRGI